MGSLKEDINEFMGVPYDEIVKDMVNSKGDYKRSLWEEMVGGEVTREKVWEYYKSDRYAAYLFWQAVQVQETPVMPQVLANVMISTHPYDVSNRKLYFTPRSILDYGCGNGMMDMGLKHMDFGDITLADIPHSYNKFLKFLSDKYSLGFKFIPVELWNEYPLDQEYNVIICNEVLEHVWDSELTLLHLTEHLKQLGYLYISTGTSGNDPSHLKNDLICHDIEKLYAMVEGMGLKKAFQDENGVWKIFQKV